MIHQKQQPATPSDQSGFTIIESLVAIIVVGILLTAIAPVIVLSVATRVQAKRVELASNAARSYIDGVRTGKITDPPITSDPANPIPNAPPSGTLTCSSGICSTTPAYLYCFPGDTGSCTNDKAMIVQAFGYNPTSNDPQYGYKLGLRVYRADAFQSGTLKALKDTGIQKQQTFTGGTGLASIQAPLVEMTTEISHESTTFSNFCDRLKQPTATTQSQCSKSATF